jgi:hypothetical protein
MTIKGRFGEAEKMVEGLKAKRTGETGKNELV